MKYREIRLYSRVFYILSILIGAIISGCIKIDQTPPYNAQGEITGEVTSTSVIIHTRLTLHPERNKTIKTYKRSEFEVVEYSPDMSEEVVGKSGWVRILISQDSLMQTVRKLLWRYAGKRRDYAVQFRITNLEPGTRYYFCTEMKANLLSKQKRSGDIYTFKTAPHEETFYPVDFTVITSTSANVRDVMKDQIPWGFQSFLSIKEIEPDFIVHTGDNVYYDSDSPLALDKDLARYHWHRVYSLPCVKDLFRTVPGYFMKDDHDYRWNDAYPQQEVPHKLRQIYQSHITDKMGRKLFLEAVPMSKKTYRNFTWGKGLEIWLVEGRDFRSSNIMPDGPDKTIWGKKQKEWLKNGLSKSKRLFKILISPTPIVGPDRMKKTDNHANSSGFKTEGREFLNWVVTQNIKNFYIICGDRHWQYHSIDSTGVEEFSCGTVSHLNAFKNQPRWDKDRHPHHSEGHGGFLRVKLGGTELKMIFCNAQGESVYEVSKYVK
jgi:phosphodiesterase/alkaline phosphatase D-like protein